VGYESWLERDRLVLLDFDPDVVGIASQPFWLFWATAEGKARSHAPDYFARLADGSALVLDVRSTDRIKPRDRVAFDATREACDALGWRYEVAGAPPASSRAARSCPPTDQPIGSASAFAAFGVACVRCAGAVARYSRPAAN
jgi:hypothetical protein